MEGALPGDLVGPFAVSGSVSSAAIDFAPGIEVYSDAGGSVAVPAGSALAPGAQLWVRYDATLAPEGFMLSASATVLAVNVFLYNGSTPLRPPAPQPVLHTSPTGPTRAPGAGIPHPPT